MHQSKVYQKALSRVLLIMFRLTFFFWTLPQLFYFYFVSGIACLDFVNIFLSFSPENIRKTLNWGLSRKYWSPCLNLFYSSTLHFYLHNFMFLLSLLSNSRFVMTSPWNIYSYMHAWLPFPTSFIHSSTLDFQLVPFLSKASPNVFNYHLYFFLLKISSHNLIIPLLVLELNTKK